MTLGLGLLKCGHSNCPQERSLENMEATQYLHKRISHVQETVSVKIVSWLTPVCIVLKPLVDLVETTASVLISS